MSSGIAAATVRFAAYTAACKWHIDGVQAYDNSTRKLQLLASDLEGEYVAAIDYILDSLLIMLHPGGLEGDRELGSAAWRNNLRHTGNES